MASDSNAAVPASKAQTGAVPPLRVRDKVSYGLGSTAEALVYTGVSMPASSARRWRLACS